MTFQTIAVFGATGNIGTNLVKALLKDKSLKITIIARPDSLKSKKSIYDQFVGATIKEVQDLTNVDQVANALEGIQVVISTVAGTALQDQIPFIKASQKAGVKRFYPSEYGIDDHSFPAIKHPLIDAKKELRKLVLDSDLQLVVAFTGFFAEWAISPFYAFNFDTHSVEIVGDGNQKISFSTLEQTGEIIAQSINHPKLQSGKEIYFSAAGFVATENEIIAIKEKSTGKTWTKTFITVEQAEKRVATNNNPWGDLGTHLRIWQAKGFSHSQNTIDFKLTPKAIAEIYS